MPIRNVNDCIAVFSDKGYGKKVLLSEIPLQKRAGKGVVIYKPTSINGNAIAAQLVSNDDLVLIIGNKTSICISANEIPEMGRQAMGNIMIKGNKILSVSKVWIIKKFLNYPIILIQN